MIRTAYKPCPRITYSFCALDRSALLESLQRMISLARSVVGGRSSTSRICSGSGWTKEYLPTLQKRMKWTEFRRNVHAENLVLVVEMFMAIGESIEDLPEQG